MLGLFTPRDRLVQGRPPSLFTSRDLWRQSVGGGGCQNWDALYYRVAWKREEYSSFRQFGRNAFRLYL